MDVFEKTLSVATKLNLLTPSELEQLQEVQSQRIHGKISDWTWKLISEGFRQEINKRLQK